MTYQLIELLICANSKMFLLFQNVYIFQSTVILTFILVYFV